MVSSGGGVTMTGRWRQWTGCQRQRIGSSEVAEKKGE